MVCATRSWELGFSEAVRLGLYRPGNIVVVGDKRYIIPNMYFDVSESKPQEIVVVEETSKKRVLLKDAVGESEWGIEF